MNKSRNNSIPRLIQAPSQNGQNCVQKNLKPSAKFTPIYPPEDVTWPLFKLDNENFNKFWNKRTAKDMNKIWYSSPFDLFFSGSMLRIGKKKKAVKGYFYRLTAEGILMYFKKENDSAPKGFLVLTLHTRASLIKQKTKKNKDLPVVYIERCQGVGITIFDHEKDKTMNFFDNVKEFCLVRGYGYLYIQSDLLGQGSFASVYKVQNQYTTKYYAAKTYTHETFQTNQHKEKYQQMVYNEMLILKDLEHPGIMKIYEIFQEKDKLVIIMEYISGGTMYSFVKSRKKVTEKTAAQLLKGTSEALQEMHRFDQVIFNKKYVHRDLKLENIMIDSKENMLIKLIDFGFAETINDKELTSRAGTPGYIPPEIFRMQPYSAKGDIFSLGIIFYSIIVGKAPFKAINMAQIVDLNRKCVINWDNASWLDVSPDCKHLLKKMLEPRPNDRITCQEILESNWIMQNAQRDSNFQTTSGLNKISSQNNEPKSSKSILNRSDYCDDKSFYNDFSYHTNDMKSFYQKNSQKTVNSQKSNVSMMQHPKNKLNTNNRSVSANQRPSQQIDQQDYQTSFTVKSSKRVKKINTDFQELEHGSFGEINRLSNQKSVNTNLDFNENLDNTDRPNVDFLKKGYQVFNQPKKPNSQNRYGSQDLNQTKSNLINNSFQFQG